MNDTSFAYEIVAKDLQGSLNWLMEYEWIELSSLTREEKPHPWAPHKTPVMAGGIFAINADRFKKLGYYDNGKN